MKKILVYSLLTIMAISVTSCVNNDTKVDINNSKITSQTKVKSVSSKIEEKISSNTKVEDTKEIKKGEDKMLKFEIVKNPNQEERNIIENSKKQRGYFYDRETKMIVVSAGKASNSGPQISIQTIEVKDDVVKVTVKEEGPKKGEQYLSVISYPYSAAKITDEIDISTKKLEVYSNGKLMETAGDIR